MKKYIIIATFVAIQNFASAQDTLRTDIFDIVKPFKPILSEAMKIQSNPNPEVPEVTKPTFNYTLPASAQYSVTPTVYTIKPLSMGTALLPKLKNNYTRLGYGNYNTPLFEVYLNTVRNKNTQAGVFYKHLSSSPSGENTFSNNTLYLFGKKFMGKGILTADAYYYRNRVNVYARPATERTNQDIANLFNTFDGSLSYSNVVKDTSKLGYKLNLKYYLFNDNRNIQENDFQVGGNFNKRLKGNPLDVYTNVHLTNVGSLSRVFVDIAPKYKLNMGSRSYITVGFNSTYFNDSNESKLYFFPTVEYGNMLIEKSLTLFGGLTGNLQRHTYRSITLENPFVRQLGFRNTANTLDLYAGFRGLISQQTSFLVQFDFATVKYLMFYGADTLLLSPTVIYDNSTATVTTIKTELNHEFSKQFRLGFVMNYTGYSLQINAPYSRPTFTTQTNLFYNISDKLLIKVEAYTMNKRKVFLEQTRTEKDMKGWVDLNTGLEYVYNKNTSLFINFNNITNNKYDRWYALPVYGFNLLGGMLITF